MHLHSSLTILNTFSNSIKKISIVLFSTQILNVRIISPEISHKVFLASEQQSYTSAAAVPLRLMAA